MHVKPVSLKSLALVMLIALIGAAQGGSFFGTKANGLGLKTYDTSVRGIGMGYSGIAAADSISLASFALSQWRHIVNTRATIGLFYQGISTEFSDNSDIYHSTANFNGFNMAVPLVQKKWVFGLSVTPYTNLDFKTTEQITSQGETFRQLTTLSGNITRAQFNLAWAPRPNLGISANFSYFFGRLSDTYNFSFENANFQQTTHRVDYRFSGPGFGFSADFQPTKTVMLAAFVDFTPGIDLSVDYDTPVALGDRPVRNFDAFPLHFGVGSSFHLGERWRAALDFSRQNWGESLKTNPDDFDDWQMIGIGLEHTASRKRNAGFFSRNDLRAGISVKQLGYRYNDASVSEYAAHLGIGFPFGNFLNRVDFALVGGFRGDLAENLAEERFVKLHTSISIGELWFQKIR